MCDFTFHISQFHIFGGNYIFVDTDSVQIRLVQEHAGPSGPHSQPKLAPRAPEPTYLKNMGSVNKILSIKGTLSRQRIIIHISDQIIHIIQIRLSRFASFPRSRLGIVQGKLDSPLAAPSFQ